MKRVKISIVIATRKKVKKEFMATIQKSLKNSRIPGEIIEINEGTASHARNKGIMESKGEVIIFVDDDVKLRKDSIRNIWLCYKKRNGIIQGKIIGVYGCADFRGSKIRPFLRWSRSGSLEISSAATSFSLFPREIFEKGIYFDEHLFPWEDVDICIRAKKSGFKIYYCPNAVAYHYSLCKRRFSKYWFKEKIARLRFILKHLDIFFFGDYL